jgi:hypothetical protein
MKRLRRISCLSVSSAILGCGAAIHWQESCGCAPLWPALVQELGLPSNTAESTLTPVFVAASIRKRLEESDRPIPSLTEIRSLGPLSETVCSAHLSRTVRCTYWLWEHEGDYRGIQVDVQSRFDPPEITVNGKYVFDKNDG